MMTNVERWLLTLLSALVSVSGLAYLWMKYFLEPSDPFAVVNHPWQPAMLKVHVLSAPALLVVFGMVWTSHVRGKIDAGQRYSRRTGLTSLWAFLVMAGSGYLLPVLTNETAHRATIAVHAASGVLFLAAYGGHFIFGLRRNGGRHRLRSVA